MEVLCTYFDQAYLPRGLALHESLQRHWPGSELIVLCLDDETDTVLRRLKLRRVHILSLRDLERADPALAATRGTRSQLGYYFTCTPCLIMHVLRTSGARTVCYVDADLFFFSNPSPILEALEGGAIYVHPHLYGSGDTTHLGGTFNVGLVGFRQDVQAHACLELWRSRCLDWCERDYQPGRFGDQQFLDEWPHLFDRLVISRHCGVGLGPWNLPNRRITQTPDGLPMVDGTPIVFYHFSGLEEVIPGVLQAKYLPRLTTAARVVLYRPYIRALAAKANVLRALGMSHATPLGGLCGADRPGNSLREVLSLLERGWRARSLLLMHRQCVLGARSVTLDTLGLSRERRRPEQQDLDLL